LSRKPVLTLLKRFLTNCTEEFGTGIQSLAVTLALLFFMTGCQAMTGQTMGENIDDSYITGAVKTQLASDKLVSLTRVEVETNNGIVDFTGQVQTAEQRSHIGSLASQVSGVKRVVNNLQVINR
jgi:osmotically-inducible protein OsmY